MFMESTVPLDMGCRSDYHIRIGKNGKEFVKNYIIKPHVGMIKSLEYKLIPRDAFDKHLV
jgi:hypothetical protein